MSCYFTIDFLSTIKQRGRCVFGFSVVYVKKIIKKTFFVLLLLLSNSIIQWQRHWFFFGLFQHAKP